MGAAAVARLPALVVAVGKLLAGDVFGVGIEIRDLRSFAMAVAVVVRGFLFRFGHLELVLGSIENDTAREHSPVRNGPVFRTPIAADEDDNGYAVLPDVDLLRGIVAREGRGEFPDNFFVPERNLENFDRDLSSRIAFKSHGIFASHCSESLMFPGIPDHAARMGIFSSAVVFGDDGSAKKDPRIPYRNLFEILFHDMPPD